MAKVPVAEGSEKISYYKYYQMDIASLRPEQMQYIANSKGTSEQALAIEDRNKLVSPDYVPEPTGYYPLKTGGMLVSSTLQMPDCTGEMLNWWWPWHCIDQLRYAIWNPEDHFDTTVPEEAKKRILNPCVPIPEKIWGCKNTVMESVGGPADEIMIGFENPALLGYDTSKVGTEDCEFLIAANALMGAMKVPVLMTEVARRIDGVMTFMARFWIGYQVIGGEAKYLLPPEVVLPEEIAMGLIGHNLKEFAHLNKILPSVYKEEKNNW